MQYKEVQHPVEKKKVWFAFGLAILTFFALVLFSLAENELQLPVIDSPIEINGEEADFPSTYKAKPDETVTYRIVKVPEADGPNPIIFFHTNNTYWTVHLDGQIVDSYSEQDVKKGTTIGRRWNMVFIPQRAVGKDLDITFRVESCVSSANLPGNIYYAGYRTIMNSFTGKFAPALIIILAIGLLSVIYVLLSEVVLARMGENHMLSGLGVSGLTMAIWMLAQNDATGFFLGYSYGLIAADYMSYLNMQGLLLQAFILYVTSNVEKTMRFKWFEAFIPLPYFLGSVLVYNLDVYGIVPYETSVLVSNLLVAALLIFITATCGFILFDRKHRFTLFEIILYYGILLLTISGIVDQVENRLFASVDHSAYTRISLLIFLFVVGSYEINSFFRFWKEGEEAKVESKLAYLDGLTGLANRMAFNDAFSRLMDTPVGAGVVSLDVNELKGTNDNYGHVEGDKLLQIAASSIKEAFENIGTTYRYGGDEFVVLIPNYSRPAVERACNKLDAIERRINADGVLHRGLSIAYGMAKYDAALDQSFQDVLKRADKAMYEKKRIQEGKA